MFFAPLTSIFLISESTTLKPEANTIHFPISKGNQRSVADPDSANHHDRDYHHLAISLTEWAGDRKKAA